MDKEKLMIEEYEKTFDIYGDSVSSLQWSEFGTKERMEALVFNLELNGANVLDFGCGLAHFKDFLDEKFNDINYNGVDIVEKFIINNKEKYKNSVSCSFKKINKYQDVTLNYDYVFISGVFNILIKNSFQEQFDNIKEVLTYLFSLSNIALSINFMNKDVDFINDGSYHQDVLELYKFISSSLSKRFVINQSYMPYEFTVTIYKNQSKVKNVYEESVCK